MCHSKASKYQQPATTTGARDVRTQGGRAPAAFHATSRASRMMKTDARIRAPLPGPAARCRYKKLTGRRMGVDVGPTLTLLLPYPTRTVPVGVGTRGRERHGASASRSTGTLDGSRGASFSWSCSTLCACAVGKLTSPPGGSTSVEGHHVRSRPLHRSWITAHGVSDARHHGSPLRRSS